MKSEIIAVVSVGVASTGIVAGLIVAIWSDVSADIGNVRDEIAAMRSDVGDNRERLARVEGKLEEQSRQLVEIKNTIGAHEARFDQIEQTLVSHSSSLDNIVKVIALAGWGDEGVAIVENVADQPVSDGETTAKVVEHTVDQPEFSDDATAQATESEEAIAYAVAEAIEYEPSYAVITEKDSSFGNVRRRVTLEIEIAHANPTSPVTIRTMMDAAIDRYILDQPDAVLVRLWRSYNEDSSAINRIVYSLDGCGWSGDECTGELWTELLKGNIPKG